LSDKGRSAQDIEESTEMHQPDEGALRSLLAASHRLPPDKVAATVASHIDAAGMTDSVLCLVDLDQRLLIPLAPDGEGSPPPVDIETSDAGRAFRTEQVVAVRQGDGAGTRLWVPLMDGAERLGVLGAVVEVDGEEARSRLSALASVAAAMVVSKSAYGDNLVMARRLRDMDLAAELRWSNLPPLTFTNDRVAISGLLEPAYEIAGDAFDYAVNGELVHVAIIDAMGHGLEASRMANLALAGYRHSRRRGLDLLATFKAIDEVVADQFGPERYVTGQLAQLDLGAGRLKWVNAGHPRPLLFRHGHVVGDLAGETSLPLGLGDVPAETAQVSLEPGDLVLFMTDGVLEARSPQGQLFGRARLEGLLTEAVAGGEVPSEIMRKLCHSVLDHQRGRLQDDATLLLVIWKGPPG
jgi:hypothetical protein